MLGMDTKLDMDTPPRDMPDILDFLDNIPLVCVYLKSCCIWRSGVEPTYVGRMARP